MHVTRAPYSPIAASYEIYKATRPETLLSRLMIRIIFHGLSCIFICEDGIRAQVIDVSGLRTE